MLHIIFVAQFQTILPYHDTINYMLSGSKANMLCCAHHT